MRDLETTHETERAAARTYRARLARALRDYRRAVSPTLPYFLPGGRNGAARACARIALGLHAYPETPARALRRLVRAAERA